MHDWLQEDPNLLGDRDIILLINSTLTNQSQYNATNNNNHNHVPLLWQQISSPHQNYYQKHWPRNPQPTDPIPISANHQYGLLRHIQALTELSQQVLLHLQGQCSQCFLYWNCVRSVSSRLGDHLQWQWQECSINNDVCAVNTNATVSVLKELQFKHVCTLVVLSTGAGSSRIIVGMGIGKLVHITWSIFLQTTLARKPHFLRFKIELWFYMLLHWYVTNQLESLPTLETNPRAQQSRWTRQSG